MGQNFIDHHCIILTHFPENVDYWFKNLWIFSSNWMVTWMTWLQKVHQCLVVAKFGSRTCKSNILLHNTYIGKCLSSIQRAAMELRRDRSVTTRASDSTQQCGVGARDRKSPCGHVVCSPSSEQLEVGHSLSHVTNNSRDDDVIAGQPISVGWGDTLSRVWTYRLHHEAPTPTSCSTLD